MLNFAHGGGRLVNLLNREFFLFVAYHRVFPAAGHRLLLFLYNSVHSYSIFNVTIHIVKLEIKNPL